MFIRKIDRIYDDQFDEVALSIAEDKFKVNFLMSNTADIPELSKQTENTIFLHNRINSNRISYEFEGKNIIFTGDVDVILKLVKNDLIISAELYNYLMKDKDFLSYINQKKQDINKLLPKKRRKAITIHLYPSFQVAQLGQALAQQLQNRILLKIFQIPTFH